MRNYYLLILFIGISLFSLSAQTHNWSRSNPGGGGAFSTIGAGPTGIIVACSDLSGAYISSDGGSTWSPRGAAHGLTETHISGIGFHPSDGNIFFIGTENGLYRTQNGGNSFTKVLNGGYITDIDMNNSGIGYLTYQTAWNSTTSRVYKTSNAGATWQITASNPPNGLHLLKTIIHPTNANIVYLLSGKGRFACGDAKVFRSSNGGASWVQLTSAIDPVLDIELDPLNPTNLYMTTMEASCSAPYYWTSVNGNFYKSTDGGDTWGSPLSNNTGVIWPSTSNANTIRLIDPREPWPWNSKAGTFTSINGGVTFVKTGDVTNWDTFFNGDLFYCYSSSFNGIVMSLGKDLSNNNNFYWVNYQWIFKTINGGTDFNNVFTSTSDNQTWTSRGIDNVNMMDVETNPSNQDLIYQAYFDIGLWKSINHGATWSSCNPDNYTGNWNGHGGNCADVLSDPMRSNVVWATMSGNQQGQSPTYLLKNFNTGEKNSWITSNTGLPQNLVMGISLDKQSSIINRTLYITANHDVYKSTNDGDSWVKIFDCNQCQFTAVDNVNNNLIYAGGAGGVWRSENGGATWVNINHADFPASGGQTFWDYGYDGVWSIETDPNIQNRVYVTAKGNSKGLYVSNDKGASWQKILTDDYMRKVKVAHFNSNVIYATSSSAFEAGGFSTLSNGIWYSEDAGISWSKQNDGMTFPFAIPIAIDYKNSPSVFVGSPGTGFQSSLIPISALGFEDLVFWTEFNDNKVICKWNTEQSDNGFYKVLRSKDGIAFDLICTINVERHLMNFKYEDQHPIYGTSYYKLIKCDLEGLELQSWISKIDVPIKSERIKVWPNPVRSQTFFIEYEGLEFCKFDIFDFQGFKQNFTIEHTSDNTAKMELTTFPNMFLLRIYNTKTGQSSLHTLMKSKL